MRIQQIERLHTEAHGRLLRIANHRFGPRIRHPTVSTANGLQMLTFRRSVGPHSRCYGIVIACRGICTRGSRIVSVRFW